MTMGSHWLLAGVRTVKLWEEVWVLRANDSNEKDQRAGNATERKRSQRRKMLFIHSRFTRRNGKVRRAGDMAILSCDWARRPWVGLGLIVPPTEIIDLKKKFEEDKAKIEQLKQSRKFKPY